MFTSNYTSIWNDLSELQRTAPGRWAYSPQMSVADLIQTLWVDGFGSGGEIDRELIGLSRGARRRTFADQLFAVAPLYVSSYCAEQCVYCNYRAANNGVGVVRKRLNHNELLAEATFLIEQKGLRAIELVYASDPQITVEVMATQVEIVAGLLERYGGGMVGLSCEPLDIREYSLLSNAGVSFSVLWIETYDKARYAELHPGRLRKTNFDYRLEAYERMIAAEIPIVGLGVLTGLSDWRRDWAMLMMHENYLQQSCGCGTLILGTPRLKEAPGAEIQHIGSLPTTDEFVSALALHTLCIPEAVPFVSTREDWETCLRLAQGGGCLFTLNCSTIPGGYSLQTDGEQFSTYSFDGPSFAPKLRDLGFDLIYRWSTADIRAESVSDAAR